MITADCYFKIDRKMLLQSKEEAIIVPFHEDKTKTDAEDISCFCNDLPDKLLHVESITNTDFTNLSQIFKTSPLYKIHLIFALDYALLSRKESVELCAAIDGAFHPIKLPEPYKSDKAVAYDFKGELHYQFLDTIPIDELLQIYINCLNEDIVKAHKELSKLLSLCNIIAANPDKFFEIYNGFKWGAKGCANLSSLLPRAKRLDFDPDVPLEIYTQRGNDTAQSLSFSSAESLIESWLHADQMQAEYCRLLDAALLNFKKAGSFLWVKGDIFKILEREAMKQVYAFKYFRDFEGEESLSKKRDLYQAMKINAENGVDDNIQKLLTQSLSSDFHYSGAAESFALQAEERWAEYHELNA